MLVLLSAYNGTLPVGSCMLALLCHDTHCRDRDRGAQTLTETCVRYRERTRGENGGNKQYLISGPIH